MTESQRLTPQGLAPAEGGTTVFPAAATVPGGMRGALAQCRRHLIAAAAFSALVNLLYIAPTLYMLQVYDRVVPTKGLQTLGFLTAVLLFALACLALLDRIRSRLLVRAGVLLDATLGRPESPAARQALRDLDHLRGTLVGPGILALFDAPWTPIYILVCFLVHPWIGIVALAGGLILPLIAWRNEAATRDGMGKARDVAARTYAAQDGALNGAEGVKALGMRRAFVARQLRQRLAMLTLQTEAGFQAGGYLTATKFVRLALQSLALGLGAMLAVDNLISGGAIFASSFLIARALAPIEQLIGSWKPLTQAYQGYRGIDVLLAADPWKAMPTRLPAPTGALKLESVTVLTPNRTAAVLNAVSFSLDAGEVLAIVGPSGSGKSSLARAIVGALPLDRGAVRFGEASLEDWDPELLARHIGYLPQDAVLFEGTIKENISRFAGDAGGDPATIDAEAVAAAEKVGALALIQRLPGGFDHRLQLGGRGISAGQAQRIALARAAYGNPALYVLDEPNAHLDSEGDAALNATIARLKAEGRTIVVISHKLGVLPVVDRMLVIRDGRADLFGTRDEVLAKIAPSNVRRMVPPPTDGSAAQGGAA